MPSPQVDTQVEQNAAPAEPESMPLCHGPRVLCPFPTVTAAFYHQVCTNGSSIAAKDLSGPKAREMTYSELCRSASSLRARLLSVGVKPGDRIPLVVKRSIEMLIGLIAILSCGAQYVPLDGGVVPDSTLQVVLAQCAGQVVVSMSATKHRLQSNSVACIVIEEYLTELNTQGRLPQPEWEDLSRPEDGCYVIYTSGTTGIPKGVNVSHANVTNLVCLSPGNLSIKKGTKVGQVLNVSFDMAAWEILGCLCNGGTLVLRGSKWEETLKEVNVLICTPSILARYDPEAYPNIRVSATAGEPSNVRLAEAWSSNGRTYYNCCGPTETTIVNTMHEHVTGGPLTIGKPTPNNSVYILDENLNHVPIGAVGTMWAGGAGVSRGYLGLPDKTAEKYLGNKFDNDGTMMYNTGDLGRWREDGEIDIIGRVDDQVKVKGFRIELDGVSASLASAPGVHKAVALLIDGEIHGFISPACVELEEVQEHMTKCQPYYAIPSKLTILEAFPLTNNGKVDKHVLRDIAAAQESGSATTARDVNSDTSSSTGSGGSTLDLRNSLTPMSSLSSLEEKFDINADLPNKDLPRHFRGLRHRAFIVYRRLFSLVGLVNITALVLIFAFGFKGQWLSTITAMNLVVAVLVRQDFVINALYTIVCSVPKSFPLSIRARCGKIYHLGGVHSGAAFCASAWLLASNVSTTVCQSLQCEGIPRQSLATKVLSWILTGLFAIMLGSAWPSLRKAHHDLFERLHRFVGWTMLVIFWIQTILSANDGKSLGQSLGGAVARTPAFWLLLVATCSIATSWLFLRKVPVVAEVLSDHAVRLHFGYTVPVNGSFTRLSRRPLLEWHSFATIPAPEATMSYSKGYSLVVSNAGDWTKSCIKCPPTHIWVRGVPTCGVMRIATLYRRIVLIATGSGIGPVLGHIQSPSCPTQLIWSTSRPEVTFGKTMVDMIRHQIPGAVIHDTKTQGRPDLVKMGYNLARSFEAEAVIIIANEKITKKVVYGLETRGVNAYGAIWDS